MYAEWMRNFDLSLTPEEIKEYEGRHKKKATRRKIKPKDQDVLSGHKLVKTHKKSWFKKIRIDDYDANNYFSEHPLWKCATNDYQIIPHVHYEDIIILQVLFIGDNEAIIEIIFKNDYEEEDTI